MNGKFAWMGQSIYGTLANPFFHFFNVNNAKAVTVGGQTLIKHMASTINKTFVEKYELKRNPVVIIDTDSCYVEMKPIIDKLKIEFNDNKSKIDYYLKFIDTECSPIINTALNDYSTEYNTDQLMNFKHEKIITKLAVFVKKHYISQVIYSEGDIYDPPEMKYTGVQTVRSDTPEFCRGTLVSLIDMIFDKLDRKAAIERIIQNKAEFERQPINKIASTKGMNKFDSYAISASEYVRSGVVYPLKCPIQIKAAIAYNFIIERDKLPLIPAGKGTKIKYIYVDEKNIAQTNSIGFIGKWPSEFNKYFKINYDEQFKTTFLPIVEDLFVLLNWEEINYEENMLDDILE
jgi:DNA polymerase elongation subunit (family B)